MIPTYRRVDLLKEAIVSALAQKNFTHAFEVVIVDNDATGEYAEQIIAFLNKLNDKRVCYYRNSINIGMFGNWNRCITLAHGKYMTILSDDDLLTENYLSEMSNILLNNKNIDRIECRYLTLAETNTSGKAKFKNFISHTLLGKNFNLKLGWYIKAKKYITRKLLGKYKPVTLDMYLTGCFTAPHAQLYKVQNAKTIGGFNSKYYPYADYVFNTCYLKKFPNAYQINEYLCVYRVLVNASLASKVIKEFLIGDAKLTQYILDQQYSVFNKLIRQAFIKVRYAIIRKRNSQIINKLIFKALKVIRAIIKSCKVSKLTIK
jgi:glycosyltransferase involved in cell wall biosynthesis